MRGLLCLLAACSGSGTTTPGPAAVGPPAQLDSPPAGADDVVVATVAGKPVWGSCVKAQVARGAKTKDAALRECIDVELLSQAAARYATDREVIEETRRELVSRMIETGFEARYKTPGDATALIDREIATGPMEQPEMRASAYVRVLAPEKASADVDRDAHALADRIEAALANETGLFNTHMFAIADRVAQGTKLEVEKKTYRPAVRHQTVPAYDAALFAIPEVGRVSPVFRTQWGWDIVLLTDLVPEKHYTRAEVENDVFAYVRHKLFEDWIAELKTKATIEKNEALLEDRQP